MDIKTKIGLRIKEIRTEKELTQEAVAFKAEIDRTFMNHVENGKRNVSVDTLEKLVCSGLEMSFKDFLTQIFLMAKRKGDKMKVKEVQLLSSKIEVAIDKIWKVSLFGPDNYKSAVISHYLRTKKEVSKTSN
ncbi:MAG: helix-turn-helix transcriptional regulator [Chitinophagaceae bacterium]|nr:helix-turn-helix transcriptional regulator [Chitinophagaceae bacterium]